MTQKPWFFQNPVVLKFFDNEVTCIPLLENASYTVFFHAFQNFFFIKRPVGKLCFFNCALLLSSLPVLCSKGNSLPRLSMSVSLYSPPGPDVKSGTGHVYMQTHHAVFFAS
jgi:hypothetical protein